MKNNTKKNQSLGYVHLTLEERRKERIEELRKSGKNPELLQRLLADEEYVKFITNEDVRERSAKEAQKPDDELTKAAKFFGFIK